MAQYKTIQFKPISGALGAEVRGVDLSGDIDADTRNEIQDAFHEYIVLLFRDQDLTDQQHFDFAQRFGKIIPHPYVTGIPSHPEIFQIIREPGESYSWDSFFHSDLMFLEQPPLGAALYAKEVPPYGGDTAFCNMYLAYETLSEAMKHLLEGLEVENESGDPAKYHTRYQSMHERKSAAQGAIHPAVRIHPETGRKALYVSLAFSKRFKGMTDRERRAVAGVSP